MIIEIITTGDEVLTGFTVDTNASWVSLQLLEQGWQVRRRQTVGDRMDDLTSILHERSLIADVIIFNGGLGPTSDDKTTDAVAQVADVPLVLNQTWLDNLEQKFSNRGRVMPVSNRKQAMLPQGATVLDNPIGTACGFKLKINRAWCYFTPGVPNEFKQMVQQQIIPNLLTHYPSGAAIVRRYFTFGISESSLSDMLDPMVWPAHIELGYRSSMPIIEMKLISQEPDADFESAEKQLLSVITPYLVASDQLDMPKTLTDLLQGPLEILEGGTYGQLLSELAQSIPQLCGDYHAHLPDTADELLQHIQHHSQLTLAIGAVKDQHYPIALWDGLHGWAQTLYVRTLDVSLQRRIVSFAAQDMLRRYLLKLPVLGEYQTLQRTDSSHRP
jgi:nicotinamide-nucleotide amidase